jgi:hypothetical protein
VFFRHFQAGADTKGYAEEMLWQLGWGDDVRLFIKCCCTTPSNSSQRVGVKKLFEEYRRWAGIVGLGSSWKKVGIREFSRRVEGFGYAKKRMNNGVTFDLAIMKEKEWLSME